MKNNDYKYKELESLILKRNKDESYGSRINKELDLIKKQVSSEFFLTAFNIASDLKQKKVIIGPSNGYANSSLINFTLGLTTINPIKYDLICEPYFNLDYNFLNINVSDKRAASKKYLKHSQDIGLKIEELPILKKYQINLAKVDYKFNSKSLEGNSLAIDDVNGGIFHFKQWELEMPAMIIKDENDLINSIAFSHFGLKGFHLSRILHKKHISFKEFPMSNGFLLFQEQWINLVAKFSFKCINDVWKLKLKICTRKYLLNNFVKNFSKTISKEMIIYLFEIIPYLPSKSHTVAEAHILSLSLNCNNKKARNLKTL